MTNADDESIDGVIAVYTSATRVLREITEILKYVLWALSGDVTTIIETTKIAPQTARQQYLLQAGGIGA